MNFEWIEEVEKNGWVELDGKKLYVPRWFGESNGYGMDFDCFAKAEKSIVKQSEKAVQIASAYGRDWVPKSVLVSMSRFFELEEKRDAAWNRGVRYNEYLRDIAEDHGVKLGNAKATSTIQGILDKHGIVYKTKEEFAA